MTKAEKLTAAKNEILEKIAPILAENDAIQIGDFKNVIGVTVDGQEIYVEVSLIAKNFQSTAKTEAFNPIQANEDYLFDCKIKAEKAAAKEKEKAAKKAKVKT